MYFNSLSTLENNSNFTYSPLNLLVNRFQKNAHLLINKNNNEIIKRTYLFESIHCQLFLPWHTNKNHLEHDQFGESFLF